MAESIKEILEIIVYNVEQFIEFTHRDFDVFFVVYLIICAVAVIVVFLMLLNDIDKWIRRDRNAAKQRRF